MFATSSYIPAAVQEASPRLVWNREASTPLGGSASMYPSALPSGRYGVGWWGWFIKFILITKNMNQATVIGWYRKENNSLLSDMSSLCPLCLSPVQSTDILSVYQKVKWFFSLKVWDQIDTSYAKASTLGLWLLAYGYWLCRLQSSRVFGQVSSQLTPWSGRHSRHDT